MKTQVMECGVCIRFLNLLIVITCLYVTRSELDADSVGHNPFDARHSKSGNHSVSHRGESLDSSDEESEDASHGGQGEILFLKKMVTFFERRSALCKCRISAML